MPGLLGAYWVYTIGGEGLLSQAPRRPHQKTEGSKSMRVAIPSLGAQLSAPVCQRFARCRYFLFADTESGQTEALPNPAFSALEEAGFHAAQFVVENGAQAVIVVMIGPEAQRVLQNAGVTIYELEFENAGVALDRLRTGMLRSLTPPPGPDAGDE